MSWSKRNYWCLTTVTIVTMRLTTGKHGNRIPWTQIHVSVKGLGSYNENSCLGDEFVKAQPLVLDDSYHSDDEADNWQAWQPDQVDADTCKCIGAWFV